MSSNGKQPDAPTSVSAGSPTSSSLAVSFTASNYKGRNNSVTYTATSSPGSVTGTGTSPITVSGLTAGTSYTFTVRARASYGAVNVDSVSSAASSAVSTSAGAAFFRCTSFQISIGCCTNTNECGTFGAGASCATQTNPGPNDENTCT